MKYIIAAVLFSISFAASANCGYGTHWDSTAMTPDPGGDCVAYPSSGGSNTATNGQGQSQQQQQANRSNNANTATSQGSTASVGGSTTNEGGTSVRAYAIGLPNVIQAVPLSQPTSMCVLSQSSAKQAGWNFAGTSDAKQTIDEMCVWERQAVAFEQQCKYRTAAAIRYFIARKIGGNGGVSPANRQVDGSGHELAPEHQPTNEIGAFLMSNNAVPYASEVDLPMSECGKPKVVYLPAPVVAPTPVVFAAPPVMMSVAPAPIVKRRVFHKPAPKACS